ncbi:protein CHUP1, chloroplastic isoform X1 [Pistacia vera]|uniref:protein CHUP1, chloroplastic isoform X1 n=2 Tax=Pistacia vera TaxID=55513 RepID=UPI001262B736|nr:protein CHUP1, chloroplastic isoform X1 [Pistacia vera]XP_031267706.1 protein CHUP1, chloroplastic isoform X1 [Pistacia vera]
MKLGDKRDIRPILIKVGVALTISLAGFIYSRLRPKRPKPSLPPPPSLPRNSDSGDDLELRGRAQCKDDVSSCSIVSVAAQKNEDSYEPKATADNSMVDLSPSSRLSGDNDGLLLPEYNDLVKDYDFASSNSGKEAETPRSDVESPKAFRSSETDECDEEVRQLTNMVKMLRERERNLEIQLLEYYGLKEQETAVMELQNRLKINNMETKLLTLKIESLQANNRRLEAQVADYEKIVAELEAARSKIKVLKKKLRSEAEHNKEQILVLQKRVAKLQEQDYKAAASDPDTQAKLQRLKVLEDEAEELRKSNMKLQLENSELAKKLDSTQMLAISVMENPEMEALKETSDHLKQENESLTKEIEQLQADKCVGVEELVYLKWINACLRYELRNYEPPAGKTVARDLSKTLSPQSEDKAKRLIVEYANTEGGNITDFDSEWSSSQMSYLTDSEIPDDSSADKSSRSKTNNSSRVKFLKKLRKLIHGKDVSSQNRASSTSCEEGDLSAVSTGTNTASTSEVQSSKVSRSSYRHSFDIQRLRVKEYDLVDEGSGYEPVALHRAKTADLAVENQLVHQADLMKFAKVLKNNHGRRRKKLRNYSSFSFG